MSKFGALKRYRIALAEFTRVFYMEKRGEEENETDRPLLRQEAARRSTNHPGSRIANGDELPASRFGPICDAILQTSAAKFFLYRFSVLVETRYACFRLSGRESFRGRKFPVYFFPFSRSVCGLRISPARLPSGHLSKQSASLSNRDPTNQSAGPPGIASAIASSTRARS